MKFVPNPEGFDRMQQHMNGKAQTILGQVNAEMVCRPAPEVLSELINRMRAAGLEPNEAVLQGYAEAISAGTCT